MLGGGTCERRGLVVFAGQNRAPIGAVAGEMEISFGVHDTTPGRD